MLIGELRATEFARLDAQGLAYLDYAGSALYGQSQLRSHFALLESGLFGNPHSESAPSRASSQWIDRVRGDVLAFFDGDESTHEVIFTANATAAIKLVAESYPFDAGVRCVLSVDNHNSVNGIREFARRRGAEVTYLGLDDELRLAGELPQGPGLFAFPAQSNFSGVCHPLWLVDEAHQRGLDVLLDAAAFAPSHPLSLRACRADFVALSFYKLFGYPTGLGALIARRDALRHLERPWFAGGTVMYAAVGAEVHRLRPNHEAFEDGTADFLGIAGLPAGFAMLNRIGMEAVSAHVARLTGMLLESLLTMDGVRVYGPADLRERGGTVAFNIDDVPYWTVEEFARERGVAVRGGCFCNPGASETAFGIDAAAISRCLGAIGKSFSVERFANCVEKNVGAVRMSIGLANNEDDVRRAIAVVREFSQGMVWRRASARRMPG